MNPDFEDIKSMAGGLALRMEKLTDDQRKEVMAEILSQYCVHCGGDGGYSCQCENDE